MISGRRYKVIICVVNFLKKLDYLRRLGFLIGFFAVLFILSNEIIKYLFIDENIVLIQIKNLLLISALILSVPCILIRIKKIREFISYRKVFICLDIIFLIFAFLSELLFDINNEIENGRIIDGYIFGVFITILNTFFETE